MTRRLLAMLTLRVLGILFLTRALVSLVQVVSTYGMLRSGQYGAGTDLAAGQWASVAYLGIVGSFGLVCLIHTKWLASRLFPEFDDGEVALGGPGLGTLAFRVLGAVGVVYALPGLLISLVEFVWGLGADRRQDFVASLPGRWADDLYWLLVVAVGLSVYRNAERLAGVRSQGTPEPGGSR
jgi:hypothetical protein